MPETSGGLLRLMVVDRHRLFRECLAASLCDEACCQLIDLAASLGEAIEKLTQWEADVLLLGLDREEMDGVGWTREVSGRFPKLKLLILGFEEEDHKVLGFLEAGARGYVFRGQPFTDLRQAISEVARGALVCSPGVNHLLFSRLGDMGLENRRRRQLDFLDLTARELEILRLIADGLSNQEIAARLFLSIHTVKNHVHNVLEALGVSSRWAAVRHATEKGWLSDRRCR